MKMKTKVDKSYFKFNLFKGIQFYFILNTQYSILPNNNYKSVFEHFFHWGRI